MSENTQTLLKESAPKTNKKLYIILGVVFALLIMFFMSVVSFESVLLSPSFYIELESDYNMSNRMDISKDGYIRYYNCFMSYMAEADESALDATTGIVNPSPLFGSVDKYYIMFFRKVYSFFQIGKWISLGLCAVIIIAVLARATKVELRLVGKTSAIAVPAIALILFLIYLISRNFVPAFMDEFVSSGSLNLFMGRNMLKDFYKGWITMGLIISVAPLALSLFLAKVGTRKREDLSDNYIYQ